MLARFYKEVVCHDDQPRRPKTVQTKSNAAPLPRCTPKFVENFITHMPLRKAPGLDGITPRMLKTTKDLISNSISALINRCLDEETIPTDWKKSLVIPIPKTRRIQATIDQSLYYRLLARSSSAMSTFSSTLWSNQNCRQANSVSEGIAPRPMHCYITNIW